MTDAPTPPPAADPVARKPFRFVLPLLWVLVVLLVALFVVGGLPLYEARRQWREGKPMAAAIGLERWRSLHVRSADYDRLLAASYLTAGRDADARKVLERASAHDAEWFPIVSKAEVADTLVTRGRYDAVLAWNAAIRDRREGPTVLLDQAASLIATGKLAEGRAAFARVNRGSIDSNRYETLLRTINERLRGSVPLVFDRNGQLLASVQLATNDLVANDRDLAPLVDANAGAYTLGAALSKLGTADTIETTIDPEVQRAAVAALSGFRGGLVAIDPKTNEILAIASSAGNGPERNLALEAQDEPGSIVKVLTGMNAVDSGVPLASMFPYDCRGYLDVDGRHFGDWLPAGHGSLSSIDDALAVSCNVVFADIGLRLGPDRLRSFMTRAGFDGQVDLGYASVPLGKNIGTLFNRFETAFCAIGLQHESVTPLHVAIIATTVANRGMMATPRLIRTRHSILGDPMPLPGVRGATRLASEHAAAVMTAAMQAVAVNPQGTGRRAVVDGVPIALKTGTAGSRANGGLDAVILAFAPANDPKIAFGMVAEDAGPAEFAGAKIAHDFVQALRGRLAPAAGR